MVRRPAPLRPVRARGFTLVELLVAITILAVIAVVSWRGLDAMARAQESTRRHADEALVLQAVLAQWSADLDALQPLAHTQVMAWDGRLLRLTRRDARAPQEGVVVVGWALRTGEDGQGEWLRWQSPPLRTRAQWSQAWQRAAFWAQQPGEEERRLETPLLPLQDWRLDYFRNGQWSPAPTGALRAEDALPDGVRLRLALPTLPTGSAFAGAITRDWVNPRLAGGRS